ncbi:MAG: hypothetical protein IPG45_17050 [Deltaproteobacteria bacterium]|nr:hypothetical protein [Deltaproteobacteria bacterium]
MRWPWLGLIGALGACGGEPVRFLGTANPTAIVIAAGPIERRTTVIDRRYSPVGELVVEGEVHPQVWVLEYEQTVTELELPARALVEDPKGLPLPSPAFAHGLRYEDGGWSAEWTKAVGLPDALAEIRYRETSPCPAVSFQQRHFGGEKAQPAFAVPLSQDRVLLGTVGGEFFEIGEDYDRRLTELSTSTPHQASFASADGEVWLLGADGQVIHGRPGTAFSPAPTLPPVGGGWLELTGSNDGGPLELYALGGGLEVARYFEGQWTMLETPGIADSARAGKDIAWIEPGLVVTSGRSSSELVEHRVSGGYRTITLQLPIQFNQDAPWKLLNVRGVGVFLGTRYNILFERREGRWIDLPQLNISPKADVMADLGRGHLVSGGNGTLAYWVDGFGYCDPLAFPTGGELRDAVAVPGHLFIFTLDRNEGALLNHFTLARP